MTDSVLYSYEGNGDCRHHVKQEIPLDVVKSYLAVADHQYTLLIVASEKVDDDIEKEPDVLEELIVLDAIWSFLIERE